MIEIDKQRCVRCGNCLKDCIIQILKKDPEGFPFVPEKLQGKCLNCQHCLAVCPAGAVRCNGVSAADCVPAGSLPDPEQMLSVLRQRRSVRHYKNENVSPEILEKLKESLAWSPTGCNVRGLQFFIAEDRSKMEFFRNETTRMLKFLIKTGILGLFLPRFKRYFQAVLDGEDVVYRGAPHMIVAAVSEKAPCAEADPWIAMSYFDLLAQSFGLGTCWCGFAYYAFKYNRKLRKKLGFPKGFRIAAVLLFGKPDVKYLI